MKVIGGTILLFLTFLLQLAARNLSWFGEWYAVTVYPCLVGLFGRGFGLFPFSVAELGLYLLIFLVPWYGISHRKNLICLGTAAWLMVGLLAFTYTINCGINYYRKPFSQFLDVEIRPSSEEELQSLCWFLARQVNESAEDVLGEREEPPVFGQEDIRSLPRQAREDMKHLGTLYPQLSGFYPQPKLLLVSRILSVQSLSGIYSPFTVEANVNREMTPYNIPHTACHELSHLRGFMREEEANFIGYLACVHSGSAYSRYSGYLSGFIHAANALYRQNPEAAAQVYTLLAQTVLDDLHTNNAFWQQYEGRISEVSTRVNDTYLKANSQSDGVKSYGRMVDLLLAYYRKNGFD